MLNIYILILNISIMKKITLLIVLLFVLACNNLTKEKKESNEVKQENTSEKENSSFAGNNFAVVWNWTTTDKQLVADNAPIISKELTKLWKAKIVENAYFDSDGEFDKFEYFPNISFFLKANSITEAENALNKLTVVKKGIAKYTIYAVGTKWLGRNSEVIVKKGIVTRAYVAVWNTLTEYDDTNAKALIRENTKAQSDAILKLWNEGVVENVYFDIEGTASNNLTTDFVFFINADSEAHAKKICNELPFVKKHLASYKISPVGVYWLR